LISFPADLSKWSEYDFQKKEETNNIFNKIASSIRQKAIFKDFFIPSLLFIFLR